MRSPQTDDLEKLLADAASSSKQRRKRLLAGVAIVAAIGLSLLLFRGDPETGPAFETAQARQGDLEVTITATGKVQGVNTVEVGAEVSGRVLEVFVDHNSLVKKGDLLALIDPEQSAASFEEANARLLVAEATRRQAIATANEAEANLERARAQAEEGLIARQDFDAMEAAALRAKAQVASAEAQLRLERANVASARSRLDRTEIRSPIDGMILSRVVEPGQTVTAGFQTPVLFKVTADLKQMRVHAQVDESDVGKVQAGQRATFTVDAWPDRTFDATVEAVRNEPIEDQTVVAYETLLSVDNDEGLLRPGMTATATIVIDERKDALLVPNTALRFQPPRESTMRVRMPGMSRRPRGEQGPGLPRGPLVWTEAEGGATPVSVRVLATDGRFSEVVGEGLEPGTPVIVNLAEPER